MSLRSIILAVCLASVPGLAIAQPTQAAPATPIERANADAVARLFARIASEDIANVPVSQIVARVDGYPILMGGLARAEQLGGPRQLTDTLVQVRLQISGARAAQLLIQAVAARPEKSPVPLDRLTFLLQSWGNRTFTSTGDNVEAIQQTMTATEPSTQPVEAMISTSRRADSAPAGPATTWRPAPAWASDPLVASGTATSVGSPLRTARAAEQSARAALRTQIAGLSLDEKSKVGDDLDKHPDVAAAIDDAVAAARVSSVDYRADGSVEVRIAVGGERLWQRLAIAR